MGASAEVIDIKGTLGVKGVKRVRCRLLDGPDSGKSLVRNIAGPIRIGDVVMLKETGIDSEGQFSR